MIFGSEQPNENTHVFVERKCEIIHTMLRRLNRGVSVSDNEYNELVVALQYDLSVCYVFHGSEVAKMLKETDAKGEAQQWKILWGQRQPEFMVKWALVNQWVDKLLANTCFFDASIFM